MPLCQPPYQRLSKTELDQFLAKEIDEKKQQSYFSLVTIEVNELLPLRLFLLVFINRLSMPLIETRLKRKSFSLSE